MKSLRMTVMVVVGMVAFSMATASSSAAACYQVDEKESGNWEDNCNVEAVKGEFVKVKKLVEKKAAGLWCAELSEKVGKYSDPKCSVPAANGKYMLVKNVPGGKAPAFVSANGEFPISFMGSSGTIKLIAGTTSVGCASESNNGEVANELAIRGLVVKFSGCEGKEGTKSCEVKSTGAGANEIVTNTLKGELGLSAQATTGVGLVLEPETTKKLVKIESTCTEPASTIVSGEVAGEISPVKTGTPQTTGKLIFGVTSVKQQVITAINVLGTTVKPELDAYGAAATLGAEDAVTYATAVEVS